MNTAFAWDRFDRIPVVGILRNVPRRKMEALTEHYLEAGLGTLEVTMNSEEAAATISSLVKRYGGQLNIGAGTVCSMEDLDKALQAGAQFVVTPIVSEDVIRACVSQQVPIFAGAFTPTEIYHAWQLGASMVKVFPASQLGPAYIKEVLAPLNQVKLLPTGGVSIDNFTEFLRAGAKGVGMGSHLIHKQLVEKEQWTEFSRFLSDFVKKYNDYKKLTNT